MSELQQKTQKIQQLQNQLDKSRKDHQDYIKQCKDLQELLQSENQKKQAEIKRLKSEAMQKEKTFKSCQTQVAEQIKEIEGKNKQIEELVGKLGKYEKGEEEEGGKVKEMEGRVRGMEEELARERQGGKEKGERIGELERELGESREREKRAVEELESVKMELSELSSTSEQKTQQIQSLRQQLQTLKSTLKSPGKIKQDQSSGKKKPEPKSSSKQPTTNNLHSAELTKLKQQHAKALKQIDHLKQELSSSHKPSSKKPDIDPEDFKRLQRTCRDLKQRVAQLTEQKTLLQESATIHPSKEGYNNLKSSYKQLAIPSTTRIPKGKTVFFNVFLTTKKHYISPFFEFNGKVVRVLKQNRNSFEKCLGSLKFTVDGIGYDSKEMVEGIVGGIEIPEVKGKEVEKEVEKGEMEEQQQESKYQNQQYSETSDSHRTITILIIGAKNTSKQLLLTQAIQHFLSLLKSSPALSPDTPLKLSIYRNRINQLPADANESLSLPLSSIDSEYPAALSLLLPKQQTPKKKPVVIVKQKQKPRNQVRYFAVEVADKLKVEFITSSNVSQIREGDKLPTSLENIVFHHLPYESNPTREIHCILTLNPIVQQYQNVRLSLNLVNQPQHPHKQQPQFQITTSPMKDEFISESVKKRMESCQKETEQHSIRMEKMENEIHFYRSRIEEALLRVKNIISVQGKNTPYLKKSPVVLTLEKLEKSLLAILQRNLVKAKKMMMESERYEEGYGEGEEGEGVGEEGEEDNLESGEDLL